jgi:tetratricopeptide (TPR) repeat protein
MQRSLRALTILSLLVAMTACGKKQEGTVAPGDDVKDGQLSSELDAKNKASKDKAKTNTLISLANEDLARGRYVSARAKANDALAVNPNNADAFAVLGASYWRGGDFDASTKAYKEAIELDRNNFGALLGLARNYQALGNHKEALELADVVLKDNAKQIDPLLTKLWSYYALADADNAVKVLDELFQFIGDNPILPLVQAQAAFMRPLEGKGELIKVEGARGTSNAGLDVEGGLKYTGAEVGGTFAPLVFFELREECRIDKELAKSLGLKAVGKIKPIGAEAEQEIVLIPEIKFRGDLKIKNIPAIVDDLSPYASIGETPGVLLGRQVLSKIGSVTFDFPTSSLEITAAAPTAAPAGAAEAPFLLLDMHVLLVPVTRVSIDGSDFSFFSWLGGRYKAGMSVTRWAYLKSGHLPREIAELDDPDQGLKMVFLKEMKLGSAVTTGLGGLVLAGTPPDPDLAQIIDGTGFELGGYINLTLMKGWKMTLVPSAGKIYVTPRK